MNKNNTIEYKMVQPLMKTGGWFLGKLKIELAYDPMITTSSRKLLKHHVHGGNIHSNQMWRQP